MRSILKCALIIIVLSSVMLFLLKGYSPKEVKPFEEGVKWRIMYKGLKDARDFTFDTYGNTYIAFSDRVQIIDGKGKSYLLFRERGLNINSLMYKDNKLYYTSGCSFAYYDIPAKKHSLILNNLPNLGDYPESKLLLMNDNVFLTIGAATNSGIVGEDNDWIRKSPFNHDFSPKALTINARNTSKNKTGAFVAYNTKNINGQVIPAHSPGNSSVIAYNLKKGDYWLYAWGIRNIEGLDFNSEGRVFCSVGGMEDRGTRPLKGDVDYIYELKENTWYGWPDYSGGDPVSSPRFKGANNERIGYILERHPTTNPPAPLYQHKSVSSVRKLAIDREGCIGEKDSIFFYDSKENILYNLNKAGILKEKIKFGSESFIKCIKFNGMNLLILDSKNGNLISIGPSIEKHADFNKSVMVYLICLIIVIIWSLLWKLKG